MTETKACTGCKTDLPREGFYTNRRLRSGLTSRCRDCMKAYEAANRDRKRIREQEYRSRPDVAERRGAQQAEYRSRPGAAEHRKAVQKARYEANRDEIIMQTRAYSRANPHIGWEAGYRERCGHYGIEPIIESFTYEAMVSFWGNGERCIYCDGPFEQADHHIAVALGGPHVIENVMPSCADCNRAPMNVQKARAQKGE